MLFINGKQTTIRDVLDRNPDIQDFVLRHKVEISPDPSILPTTDNWPYLYMERPAIPGLFYTLGAVILLLWAVTSRRFAGRLVFPPLGQREPLHFFSLGVGFILLQVFVITKASLLFGSTWIVNSVVISGMMAMILAANFCVHQGFKLRLPLVAVLLIALSCGLAALSFETFLSFSLPSRIAFGALLSGLPTLLSGLLFGAAFQSATQPSYSLGANLFGSLIGAMVQSVVFWLGINSLALIAAAAYLVALFTLRRDVK